MCLDFGIPQVQAAGLLAAPIEHEVSAAFPRPLADVAWAEIAAAIAELDAGCAALMTSEGIAPGVAAVRHFADLCYIGQGYHLEIPLHDQADEPLAALYRDFLAAHDRVYGHAAEAPARLVNLRAVHRVAPPLSAPAPPPVLPAAPAATPAPIGSRRVLTDPAAGFEDAAIYRRALLAAGQRLASPAIVEQPDTTVLIPSGWRGMVDPQGLLILEPGR